MPLKKYTNNYKNWLKELTTEKEGVIVINNSSTLELEILYKRVTGKKPTK